MALLNITSSRKIEAAVKLEESTAKLVDTYAKFVGSSADDVIDHALAYIFEKDREFQEYLKQNADANVPASLRVRKPVGVPAQRGRKSKSKTESAASAA